MDPVCAMVLASVQLGGFISVAGQQEHPAGLSSCHALMCWRGGENKDPELEVCQMHFEVS